MAVFTGTALAIKAGLKMLAKGLTKKAIKGAIKKKVKDTVKDKVKSKIKDKLLGKKKDKRQTAKNIMQQAGEFPGGGALTVTPTTSLIPTGGLQKGGALAVVDKDDKVGGSGKTDFQALSEKLDNIVGLTDGIVTVTSGIAQQRKDELAAIQERKKRQSKSDKEAKLEGGKKKGAGATAMKAIKDKAINPLTFILRFLAFTLVGGLVDFFLKNLTKIKDIWTGMVKGFNKFFWIIRGLLWEMKLPKAIGGGLKTIGEATKGIIKGFMSPFQKLNKAISGFFSTAGKGMSEWIGGIAKKIKDIVSKPFQAVGKGLKTAGKFVSNLPGIKQTLNLGKNIAGKVGGGIKAAKDFVGGGFKAAKNFVTGGIKGAKDFVGKGIKGAANFVGKGVKGAKDFVGKGLKAVGGKIGGAFKGIKGALGFGAKAGKVAGKAGGIAAKAGKIGGKLAKMGGGIMKTAKGLFGRIPIIGPLMVALASMLAGDPPGQTAFKAIGTALGGLAGSFIPIPILGTILGEMLGEFVGDLMYSLILGGGPGEAVQKAKDKFKQVLTGGQAVVKWLGGGMKRYLENFLKETAIDIPEGGGRWTAMTTVAKVLGLTKWLDGLGYVKDGMVTKFPNLLQLLNPFKMGPILAKSFFPPNAEGEGSGADIAGGGQPAEIGKKEEKNTEALETQADYEKKQGDTIIMNNPPGGGGSGGGGGGGSSAGTIIAVGSKDALNTYNKQKVTADLYKV